MSWEIKLDGNKAIDQMKELGDLAWKEMSKPATAVVVELLNETKYDFRHVGNYRWQGFFMEPTSDLKAGYGAVWSMESKGWDGSFGIVNYQLWDGGKETDTYLAIGNLLYADGAQSLYTALLTKTNVYSEGKPKNLDLLNEGDSAGRNYDYKDLKLRVEIDIWKEKITKVEENFRIVITPMP